MPMAKKGSGSNRKEHGVSRRSVLKASAALALIPGFGSPGKPGRPGKPGKPGKIVRRQGPRVVVVGAGAFGGWTALHLLRSGA